jgi:hypothetical protein
VIARGAFGLCSAQFTSACLAFGLTLGAGCSASNDASTTCVGHVTPAEGIECDASCTPVRGWTLREAPDGGTSCSEPALLTYACLEPFVPVAAFACYVDESTGDVIRTGQINRSEPGSVGFEPVDGPVDIDATCE